MATSDFGIAWKCSSPMACSPKYSISRLFKLFGSAAYKDSATGRKVKTEKDFKDGGSEQGRMVSSLSLRVNDNLSVSKRVRLEKER